MIEYFLVVDPMSHFQESLPVFIPDRLVLFSGFQKILENPANFLKNPVT